MPIDLIRQGLDRLANGELDGAIADFDKAVYADPGAYAAYHNRGIAKAEKGDLDGAMADFTKAIE